MSSTDCNGSKPASDQTKSEDCNGRASASLASRRATGECCLSDSMISGPDAFIGAHAALR